MIPITCIIFIILTFPIMVISLFEPLPFLTGIAFSLILGFLLTWLTLVFPDKSILLLLRKTRYSNSNPEKLLKLIDTVFLSAGLNNPRILILKSPSLFVSLVGVTPKKLTLLVSTSAIEKLSTDNLSRMTHHQLAHLELGHTFKMTSLTILSLLLGWPSASSEFGAIPKAPQATRLRLRKKLNRQVLRSLIKSEFQSELADLECLADSRSVERGNEPGELADCIEILSQGQVLNHTNLAGLLESCTINWELDGAENRVSRLRVAPDWGNTPTSLSPYSVKKPRQSRSISLIWPALVNICAAAIVVVLANWNFSSRALETLLQAQRSLGTIFVSHPTYTASDFAVIDHIAQQSSGSPQSTNQESKPSSSSGSTKVSKGNAASKGSSPTKKKKTADATGTIGDPIPAVNDSPTSAPLQGN